MSPRVSVIIAAYNSSATVGRALDSVFAQTMSDWQIVLVDDASTDGTPEVLAPYARDPRVVVITNTVNAGSGVARNEAIERASASVVAILDADDFMEPHRLQRQWQAFADDPDLDVLGTQFFEFGEWGGPTVGSWPVDAESVRARQAAGRMPVAHCTAMMKRSSVLAVGGYDPWCRRAQDLALIRKLRGAKFAALPEPLTYYRTMRPLPLRYAIMSGRYGELARARTDEAHPSSRTTPLALPRSILIDARSVVTWGRRRLAERLR